jgi:phage-related protein
VAADEEVTLSFAADEDVTEALRRIENRLESLDRQFVESAATARASGHEMAEAIEEVETASEQLRAENEQLRAEVKRVSDQLDDQGKKSDKTTSKLGDLAKGTEKASKKLGGMSKIFMMFKWGAIISGVAMLVPLVYALGAAAGMAVGNLASMAGVIGPMGALFLAAKAGMWAWKLAAEAIKPQTDAITKQFKDLGPQIAKGGLASGLDSLNSKMKAWVGVTGDGLTSIGAGIGAAADRLGDFTQRQDTLDLTADIFQSLDRILQHLMSAALTMLPGVLRLLDSIMPAGERLADIIDRGSTSLNKQLVAWTESGRAAAFFNRALDKTITFVKAVWNFLVGLYNILKIGSAAAGDLSGSMLQLSERFRAFTESTSGQASIAAYFEEAKPVLRELWLLIKDVVKGLGGFNDQGGLASLISQIRTELLPPLLDVLHNIVGDGGLLRALISLAAAFLRVFATIDPQGLVIIAQALADVANGLAWCAENIPGFGMLISVLFTLLAVAGPVLWVAAKILKVFDFLAPVLGLASKSTKELSTAQRVLKGAFDLVKSAAAPIGRVLASAWEWIGPAMRGIGGLFTRFGGLSGIIRGVVQVALWAGRAIIGFLLGSNPVGWIVTAVIAIIAIFVLLYNKCDWFRKLVDGIWQWIKDAAVKVWDGITRDVGRAFRFLGDIFSWIGRAFMAVVDFIIMVGKWIWDHGLKQVVGLIVWGFTTAFKIVWFVVRVAIYLIAAVIKGLLWVAEQVWSGIVAAAKWMAGIVVSAFRWIYDTAAAIFGWIYSNIVKPVVDWISARWAEFVSFISWVWSMIVTGATMAWNWLYTNVISPVVSWVVARWNQVVAFFSWLWSVIVGAATAAWGWLYANVIGPVVDWVTARWNQLVGFFSWLWGAITGPAEAAWNGLRDLVNGVADAVKGAFNAVVDSVKGVYNTVADYWNALPTIHLFGHDFEVPKLPKWEHGGYTGGAFGLAGEAGPEPVMRGGNMIGMAGLNGPEMGTMPRGSYVVPNPSTLAANPGLAKSLPASVAGALSRAMPGAYGDLLGSPNVHGESQAAPPPRPRDDGNAALARSVRGLTAVLDERPPPISVSGGASAEENRRMVRDELRRAQAKAAERRKYDYDD